MSDISVTLLNVGGLDNYNANIDIGKVTLIKGRSGSGKSSIVRGALLALVGPTAHRGDISDDIQEEAVSMRLCGDSGVADDGLLMRGKGSAESSMKVGDEEWTASLGSNGHVIGSGNNVPKAVFTTLLADDPMSTLYRRVYDADPDTKNEFGWITDYLSEAVRYKEWLNAITPLSSDIETLELRASKWKEAQFLLNAELGEVEEEIAEAGQRLEVMEGESEGVSEELRSNLNAAKNTMKKAEKDSDSSADEYNKWHGINKGLQVQYNLRHDRFRNSTREITKLEAIARRNVTRPDLTGLKVEHASLTDKVATMRGASEALSGDADGVRLWDEWAAEKPHQGFAEWMEGKRADLSAMVSGNSDRDRLKSVKAEITRLDQEWNVAMQQKTSAERDMGTQKGVKNAAEDEMAKLSNQMEGGEGRGRILRTNRDKDSGIYVASKVKFEELQEEISKLEKKTPAQIVLEGEIAQMEAKRGGVRSKLAPEMSVRLDSLGMSPSEEIQYDKEGLLSNIASFNSAEGDGEVAISSMFNRGRSKSEIQSLLYDMFEDGSIWSLTKPMLDYCKLRYEEHRQAARRVFNETGSTLFENLEFCKYNKVELDTDYNLRMHDKEGGKWVGLTGSGGEKAIVAASLLIAMRKAYTPEIPLLMFDSGIDKLDSKPKGELLGFLGEYAEKERIAIVVTTLDSESSSPQVEAL